MRSYLGEKARLEFRAEMGVQCHAALRGRESFDTAEGGHFATTNCLLGTPADGVQGKNQISQWQKNEKQERIS